MTTEELRQSMSGSGPPGPPGFVVVTVVVIVPMTVAVAVACGGLVAGVGGMIVGHDSMLPRPS